MVGSENLYPILYDTYINLLLYHMCMFPREVDRIQILLLLCQRKTIFFTCIIQSIYRVEEWSKQSTNNKK